MKYNIQFINDYPVIQTRQGMMLIDLGMPISYCPTGEIDFGNDTHNVEKQFPMDFSVVNRIIAPEIVGVIGADLLNQQSTRINYTLQQLETNYHGDDLGIATHSFSMTGYYGIKLNIGDRERKVFIDTGAPISYLLPRIAQQFPSTRSETDAGFFNNGQQFQTTLHRATTEFMGQEWDIEYGELPDTYSMILRMLQIDGVIGKHFLEKFNITIRDNTVHCSPVDA
ncbi:MAG: hypothetical protein KBT04_06720 [Bacteroidales bacterium]|nr:hypothetical protein [Candidatus Colimorpha onthohippi]